jgi:hypothetical protein
MKITTECAGKLRRAEITEKIKILFLCVFFVLRSENGLLLTLQGKLAVVNSAHILFFITNRRDGAQKIA